MDSQKRRKYYESKKTRFDAEQAQAALERAARQLTDGDYAGAVQTCQEFLPLAQERPFQRAEFLNCMGTGNMMLREYDAAYDAFTETLEIVSNDPYLWYNRGIASRMTMRSGQALQDFERAVVLEGTGSMAGQYAHAEQLTRQLVQQHLAMRGSDFTLEQLIEQEELFQQAVNRMAAGAWTEAEEMLRRVIALRDGPPQPWTNLGACLAMQRRYDEAEAAYQRALERDPNNENALHNLRLLAETRQTDDLPESQVVNPFDAPPDEGHQD
jgi:tetratricopeptide (TPR) repeat protein